jgi:hypothetical protein
MILTVITLLLILLLGAFWQSSMRARERALASAKDFCVRENWQWLDEAVSLKKIRLRRIDGTVVFWREYQFEYGVEERLTARIIVCGREVWQVGDKKTTSNVVQFPGNK